MKRVGNALVFALGIMGAPVTSRAAVPAAFVAGDAQLTVDNGQLHGKARGGTYDVKVTATRAQGRGPFGPIDVAIKPVRNGYEVVGRWDGGDLDFMVTDGALRGTALRPVASDERGLESCTYDVEKRWHRTDYTGRAECDGANSPFRLTVPAQGNLSDEDAALLVIAYLVAPPVI